MSLANQSQQWYPTSVQVTVFQARSLKIKGKNGTNDAYAIIQVAKDKFSTSVAEKCVSPVWKEEATFDLPLFHHGNADRCTLYVIVMHRALVGLDKLLGQAVVNLVELNENKSRNRTEWFKLVDKNGKADKDRGEVLLDIQFMRNNMTASMFDLSMKDKPRSGIGKLKDKIRGKKSGFSDSASAIVPAINQVVTDSEDEGDSKSGSSGAKKKSKIKSLFGPKSNLQRNVSQSMSTLGTLPEKNSLSGSRMSGLNVDSPETKKKFNFLTHKRTGSTDSKSSLGPFSLLGRPKQSTNEQSNVCINGSHVYTEEPEPKDSTLSLTGSIQGSSEDVRRVRERNPSDASVDSLKGLSVPSYRAESSQKTVLEESREAEEARKAEAEKLQEERARLEEEQRRMQQEEQRRMQQEEQRRMQQEEQRRQEEEEKRLEEQQKKQEEEERRKQEEARKAEDQKRQEELKKSEEPSTREEPTMTDRLTLLFGIGRKKEEQPAAPREPAEPSPTELPANRFEEIPLSPDPLNPFEESPARAQQGIRSPQTPSAGLPSRTAKVSAVKPRLVVPLNAESDQGKPPSPSANADPCVELPLPSSPSPDSSLSSVPSESPDMFSNLHSSLAPPNARKSSSDLLDNSNDNFTAATGSPVAYANQKRQTSHPLAQKPFSKHEVPSPSYKTGPATLIDSGMPELEAGKPRPTQRTLTDKTAVKGGHLEPETEVMGTGQQDFPSSQQGKRPPLPLPDYNMLFPKRKHGVQGQVKWDLVVSEVNLKQRKNNPELREQEMNVDSPDLTKDIIQSPVNNERPNLLVKKLEKQKRPTTLERTAAVDKQAVAPPKKSLFLPEPTAGPPQGQTSKEASLNIEKPNPFASRVFSATTPTKIQTQDTPFAKPRVLIDNENKVVNESDVDDGRRVLPKEVLKSTAVVGHDLDTSGDMAKNSRTAKEVPTVKPRQRSFRKEEVKDIKSEENPGTLLSQSYKNERKDAKMVNASAGGQINEVSKTVAKDAEWFSSKEPLHNSFSDVIGVPKHNFLEEKILEAPSSEQQLVEPDPFPNDLFLLKDPWALPVDSKNDLFGGVKAEKLCSEEIEKFFPKDAVDPFNDCDHTVSGKPLESSDVDGLMWKRSPEHSVVAQKNVSAKKQAPLPPAEEIKTLASTGRVSQDNPTMTMSSIEEAKILPKVLKLNSQDKEGHVASQNRRKLLAAEPISSVSSPESFSMASPEPLMAVTEEGAGGKAVLRAWVSPSEAQAVMVQNSSGGGAVGKASEPASTLRRPHPVKPMSSSESQISTSSLLGRDKLGDAYGQVLTKAKATSASESGPYSQLTQEELIMLVVKQQAELTKKDVKIQELEEYIDNLLVRVIEEKPSILMAMATSKKAM